MVHAVKTRGADQDLKGAVAGLVFVIAFFGLVAFFLSLEPFMPINYGLLVLWWLSILALTLAFYLFARTRTERRWQKPGINKRTP